MTYKEAVLVVFEEHNNSLGMDMEEIQDHIQETPFETIEKWLTHQGYDLNECKEEEVDTIKAHLAIMKTELNRMPMKTLENIWDYEKKHNEMLDLKERLWELEN